MSGLEFCSNPEEETQSGNPLLIPIANWPNTEFAQELTRLIEACFGTQNARLSGGYADATQSQKLLVMHAETDEIDHAVLEFLEQKLAASNARIKEFESAGEATARRADPYQREAAAALARALQNLWS